MRVPMGECMAEEGAGEVFEDKLNDEERERGLAPVQMRT